MPRRGRNTIAQANGLGMRLYELRTRAGLTQQQLARCVEADAPGPRLSVAVDSGRNPAAASPIAESSQIP